jgi:uncharacterized repeat protein (TIGR02059 family)
MRVETLPSPGLLSNGIRIRIEAAKAISAVEINAGIPANAGRARNADALHDFFTACALAINGFRDVTVPTITARGIAANRPDVIVMTASEGLSAARVPAAGSFAVLVAAAARTVTKVVVDGPFVFLTLATPVLAAQAVTVAYTRPSIATSLQDSSDNQVVNFTAQVVVNGVV